MAADKSDEPGVLGNLPRSRPGQRSSKRGGGLTPAAASATAKAASATANAASATAKASPATRAKVTRAKTKARAKSAGTTTTPARKPAAPRKAPAAAAAPPPPAREPKRDIPPPDDGAGDPLTGAVKLAGKVATIPLKTAGALIRRLPGR